MYIKNINHFYYFSEDLNIKLFEKLKKLRNPSVIFDLNINSIKNDYKILNAVSFCKKNSIKIYFCDDFKLAIKYKANGIYLRAHTKNQLPIANISTNFSIIGSAHNQMEYYFKVRQNCKMIMLSPIFYNAKYSKNKILGINRFNFISSSWKLKLIALGGLTLTNQKGIKMTKATGLGFKRLINEI